MLANNRFFLILTSSLIISTHALGNLGESEDYILGKDYVAVEDIDVITKEVMLNRGYGYGTDWIVMPDGNGLPQIAILKLDSEDGMAKTSEEHRFGESVPVEDNVSLKLYNKGTPESGEVIDMTSLRTSNFDSSKPTKIIIHGWQSSGQSDSISSIREAYFLKKNVNVIIVDWSAVARNIFYPKPALYTRKVGKYIAEIIDELVEAKGARYSDVHIIGHSLGAHISGVAGHNTKRKVSRVTGLDPALPLFEDVAELENRLDDSDAEFVEVIHTCAGALGMSSPVGHADFYPNGGTPLQPGCCCFTEIISACSHGRSHEYFTESILSTKAFPGVGCPTWTDFKQNSCTGDIVLMGENTPNKTRGIFFLQTNNEPPFGLGLDGITFVP